MSRPLRTYAVTAAFLLAAGTLVTTAAPASAKTDNLGCSSGETTYTTTFLINNGFSPEFMAQVDLNQDGIVCGKPLSAQQQEKFCSQFVGGCQLYVILTLRDNTRGSGY